MELKIYEAWEELKQWLEEEDTQELLAPSSCVAVLTKIDDLEMKHE